MALFIAGGGYNRPTPNRHTFTALVTSQTAVALCCSRHPLNAILTKIFREQCVKICFMFSCATT